MTTLEQLERTDDELLGWLQVSRRLLADEQVPPCDTAANAAGDPVRHLARTRLTEVLRHQQARLTGLPSRLEAAEEAVVARVRKHLDEAHDVVRRLCQVEVAPQLDGLWGSLAFTSSWVETRADALLDGLQGLLDQAVEDLRTARGARDAARAAAGVASVLDRLAQVSAQLDADTAELGRRVAEMDAAVGRAIVEPKPDAETWRLADVDPVLHSEVERLARQLGRLRRRTDGLLAGGRVALGEQEPE